MAYLVHTTHAGTVARYRLTSDRTVVGRGTECDISLPGPLVSRSHFEIILKDGAHHVVDLGSTIGTWVNGQRVERHVLAEGDRIAVLPHVLRFRTAPPGDGTPEGTSDAATAAVDPEEYRNRLAILLGMIDQTKR